MAIDSVSREYITLSFGIDRLFSGFIDAYFGPEEIRTHALAEAESSPRDLLARASKLASAIEAGDYPDVRKRFLVAQVAAMKTILRKLAGDEIGYIDEVRSCFDIEPAYVDERELDLSIDQLDRLLPGSGDVRERMIAWRKQYVISNETARQAISLIMDQARRRTAAFVDLPRGEEVEIVFVDDKPWSGYNWYLGSYRSRVDINTDLPIHVHELPSLVTHEAYPGHHTEHALKERFLYNELGYGEATIQLINAPECVISEGIATLAERIAFPGDEGVTWQSQVLYPAAGIQGDPEREALIAKARAALRAVGGNAALRLHDRGHSETAVVEFFMKYGLNSEAEARQRLRFIADPLWRPYIFTYHVGRDLLGRWLDRFPESDRLARFKTLLTEQITPGMIIEQIATQSS
jgi:hypothetical protein